MGMLELYKAHGISTASDSDGRHYREGWANTECPHCTGSFGYHLGFNLTSLYYSCYRCGFHPTLKTLELLLNQDTITVKRLIKEYSVSSKNTNIRSVTKEAKIRLKPFKYPTHTSDHFKKVHLDYIMSRGFEDPKKLIEEFKLLTTTPFSVLDKIKYDYRILAPIYWEDNVVSFQARDYGGHHPMRYLACPMARETMHHKYILYMNPRGSSRIGFCVEGIVDVWRFPKNGFAVFGIEYTQQQVRVIAKLYDVVYMMFDPEPQAQKKAMMLKAALEFRNVKVENIILSSDPGDMAQGEADRLTKNLLKKVYAI